MNEKELWNKLAQKNYRYYIYVDKGKNITDEQFDKSGEEDYKTLILDDEIITEKFPDKSITTILEIGCGAGRLLKPMSRDFKEIVGVDISEEMISRAMERLNGTKNISVIATNGRFLPCINDSVDLVFSYIVFQHIKSYDVVEQNFRETYRILKPGGLFKVLLGTKKYDKLNSWWGGVHFKGDMIDTLYKKFGFDFVNQKYTPDGRVWLWLEKSL
jgi:ubiquinone/menaquinone biosynthesis C-methylase UbiE